MTLAIRWAKDVAPHDYDSAEAYLSLLLSPKAAGKIVDRLRSVRVTSRRTNDVLRACRRDPLPFSDPGVARALERVAAGERLSPVLVVSFRFGGDVADGYHRVSVAYGIDPFAPCRLRLASWDPD